MGTGTTIRIPPKVTGFSHQTLPFASAYNHNSQRNASESHETNHKDSGIKTGSGAQSESIFDQLPDVAAVDGLRHQFKAYW